MGAMLFRKGETNQAIACWKRAIAAQPDFSEAHGNLGIALARCDKLPDAVAEYNKAIQLNPTYVEAYCNLGVALQQQGKFDQAINCYQRAIHIRPTYADARYNLGNAMQNQGRLDEGIECYRRALELNPNYTEAQGNLLLILHYHPKYSAADIFQEHLKWARHHAAELMRDIPPHPNDRNPNRKIRLGYVSPDYRNHPVAFFIEPILASYDHDLFEVTCYSDVRRPDSVTEHIRKLPDHWKDTSALNDADLARQIRADAIDILVDLTGHTGGNRMLLFARKPAPVQVTQFGYPDTTGLQTVDYRVTDDWADIPGTTQQYFTEQLIRLPDAGWCYRPLGKSPDVVKPPALTNGYITFGSFNNLSKVTAEVLALWAKILQAVPGSKLRILINAGGEAERRIQDTLAAHGIESSRIELLNRRPRLEYLQWHNQVDIVLDPFPYNGGVTTCDSLWMSVPIVTLAGHTYVSRQGVMLLNNVGLSELVAQTPQQYVQIAVDLVNDLPRLTRLRKELRERFQQSAVMDAQRYTRHLQAAYQDMWRRWCDEKTTKE